MVGINFNPLTKKLNPTYKEKMKHKFFIHPLTELPATPRGFGKDEYMKCFIENASKNLDQQLARAEWAYLQERSYIQGLQRALQWLTEYYQGCSTNEDDHIIYSHYVWTYLQQLDSEFVEA